MKSFFIVLILVASTVCAEEPEWITFLNHDQVNTIASEEEYIWVGFYKGGLMRLDSETNEYVLYDELNSLLPTNDVRDIQVDAEGIKWIGTQKGLIRIKNDEWTLYNTSNSEIPKNSISNIKIDKDGNLWTYSDQGLIKYDGMEWLTFEPDTYWLNQASIQDMIVDQDNKIWMGTDGQGLLTYDGETWERYYSTSAYRSNNITSLAIDGDSSIWISNGLKGLSKYDGENWTNYYWFGSDLFTRNQFNINQIKIDNLGIKWLATDQGLFKFDGSMWTVFDRSNSNIQDNNITAIEFDKSIKLWVGSMNRGLSNKSPDTDFNPLDLQELPDKYLDVTEVDNNNNIWAVTWNPYNTSDSINRRLIEITDLSEIEVYNEEVISVEKGIDGNVWFGKEGGLIQYNEGTWKYYDKNDCPLLAESIGVLSSDLYGNLWIGTEKGLAKFDGKDWIIFNEENSGLLNNRIYSLVIDSKNNKWIVTGSALEMYNDSLWSDYSLPASSKQRTLSIDSDDRLWIGTSKGPASFEDEKWVEHNWIDFNFESKDVTSIAFDSKNNMWIGAFGSYWIDGWEGGLIKYDGKNWTLYNSTNSGLPDNRINSISIDSNDNLNIGTMGGLAIFKEGGIIVSVKNDKNHENIPAGYSLSQNYPNPFNPTTNIKFSIPREGNVKLKIYDILGKEIAVLLDEYKTAGNYEVKVSLGNISSSVYFYRLESNNFTETKKMVYLK